MSETQWMRIGQIGKAHGIKGAVHVYLDNANSEILEHCFEQESDLQIDGKLYKLKRVFAKGSRCEFFGLNDRNDAEALRNKDLNVKREDFSQIKEDEYYLADLIGAQIFDVDGQKLGEIDRFEEFGSYPIAVIEYKGKEVMLPLVPDLIEELDTEQKRIIYKAPEGLFTIDEKDADSSLEKS